MLALDEVMEFDAGADEDFFRALPSRPGVLLIEMKAPPALTREGGVTVAAHTPGGAAIPAHTADAAATPSRETGAAGTPPHRTDASGAPVKNPEPYLARTADLRRAAERLLRVPEAQSKRLNLREVAARVRYRATG
jgi:hypothetical protein